MWRSSFRRSVLAVLALSTALLGGCFVRERTVTCEPTQVATSGCVWVQEYKDSQGRVHAAHYRCPGTIDAY